MSIARQVLSLAVFIAICFGAAGIGSLFTASTIGIWYQALESPDENRPIPPSAQPGRFSI